MKKSLFVFLFLVFLSSAVKGESFVLSPYITGGIVNWNKENSAATFENQIGFKVNWKRFVALIGFWNNKNESRFNWNDYLISKSDREGGELILGFNIFWNKEKRIKVNLGTGVGASRSLQWLLPNDKQINAAPLLIHKGITSYIPIKLWIEKELFGHLTLLFGIEKKLAEDRDHSIFFLGVSL